MMAIVDELRAWGCDIEGAMQRFLDDEEFYVSLLKPVVDDPSFAGLNKALAEGNVKTAFESAHTLKGVLGNMGISPMYKTVCEMVETLRCGKLDGVKEQAERLNAMRDKLRALVEA